MNPRHYLTIADLSRQEILRILDRAAEMKKDGSGYIRIQPLSGKTLGLIFEKASTRTRVSFEVAMAQLGGHSIVISSEASQITRGETIADTAKVLSRYVDGLVIRTFGHDLVREWASNATVPVINGLTDLHHPCQVLSDLFTIKERAGRLAGVKVAYIGDGNNVAHSLIEAAYLVGLELCIACPPGFAPHAQVLEHAVARGADRAGSVHCVHDPKIAAKDVEFIYTDVWTSMGYEDEREHRTQAFAGFQVNAELLSVAKSNCLVMHCLPAHRGEEITSEILDGPRSIVLDQAGNRLHAQKALLVHLLGES